MVKYLCYSVENQCHIYCDDLSDDEFSLKPPSSDSPAIGWVLGHIITVHDYMLNHIILEHEPATSEEFRTFFATGTSGECPKTYSATYQFDLLKAINGTIVTTVLSQDEGWLSQIPANTDSLTLNMANRNHSKALTAHFTHLLMHTGQILEIRRLWNKGAWQF